jgi:4-amino-4-deoxy-L-arabinose transferase-like glycosyltransferase
LKATAKRLLCSLPVIVTVAFLVRLAFYLPMVHEMYQKAVVDFPYGAETGAVAAAIAQGRGFSSPLRMVKTGPTAWFAPIFPYLLAGIFKLFGVYSYSSNLVISFFDLSFSAFTCWPIAAIATRAFGRKTGIAAAWTWVVLPTAIFYPVVWVWDTSLAALWLAMLVAATMQLRGSDRLSWWLGYGALWSAGAMINPSLISVLPPLALWAIWPLRSRLAPALKLASAAALIFAVGIVPWTIRNHVVFHKFIPLRSNFGLELWLGNNPAVPDSWSPWLHPNDSMDEAQKYARMTEIPYMEEKEREAWAFIRSHPLDTARFALHRFANHWLGIWDSPADLWPTAPWYLRLTIIFNCVFALLSWLGMLFVYRTRAAAANPLGIVMLIFPLAFYLTHTSLRYRFPMDPVMVVLAVFAVAYALSPEARRSTQVDVSAAASERDSEAVAPEEPVAVFR